jgi:hypothetical protein
MLNRAETQKKVLILIVLLSSQSSQSFDSTNKSQFVDDFVYELGVRADSIDARKKIDALGLTEPEWMRVGVFCSLLRVRIRYHVAVSS